MRAHDLTKGSSSPLSRTPLDLKWEASIVWVRCTIMIGAVIIVCFTGCSIHSANILDHFIIIHYLKRKISKIAGQNQFINVLGVGLAASTALPWKLGSKKILIKIVLQKIFKKTEPIVTHLSWKFGNGLGQL